MKILILSDSWPPESMGGADKVAFNLAREILSRGHNIRVVTTTQDKNLEGEFEYKGIRGWRVYAKYHERWRAYLSLYNLQTVRRVKKIIEDFKPEIVHAHNIHFYLSYTCLKVAKKSGAKVFLTAHDTMSFTYSKLGKKRYLDEKNAKINWRDNFKKAKLRYNPWRNLIIKYYLTYVDEIIMVSWALKRAWKDNKIYWGEMKVIYNGINAEEWKSNKNEEEKIKNIFNINNKKIILYGGRLSEGKGDWQIIKAMAKIVEKEPEVILLILGKRDLRAELIRKEVKKLGIENNIIWSGWLDGGELRAIFGICCMVVVPSVYLDPLPTVVLEAMASSKPVVGTCFGGTQEMILNGQTGIIVDPRDSNKLAEAIIELLFDKEKMRKFGEAGLKRVLKEFNLKHQADIILEEFMSSNVKGL